jgi:succinate dehydrogenase / fumarate reductase, cytochrome b subunit
MSDSCCDKKSEAKRTFRNINMVRDLPSYRLPVAGVVSILHRLSGLVLFLFLPFSLWIFDKSLTSDVSYGRFTSLFSHGFGFDPMTQSSCLPGWFMKIVALVLIWAFLHHFCAGVRHLYMDATHKVTKEFGRSTAIATLAVSLIITFILALKLFGVY